MRYADVNEQRSFVEDSGGKAGELAAGSSECAGVVEVSGARAANRTNPVPVNVSILDFLAAVPA